MRVGIIIVPILQMRILRHREPSGKGPAEAGRKALVPSLEADLGYSIQFAPLEARSRLPGKSADRKENTTRQHRWCSVFLVLR